MNWSSSHGQVYHASGMVKRYTREARYPDLTIYLSWQLQQRTIEPESGELGDVHDLFEGVAVQGGGLDRNPAPKGGGPGVGLNEPPGDRRAAEPYVTNQVISIEGGMHPLQARRTPTLVALTLAGMDDTVAG